MINIMQTKVTLLIVSLLMATSAAYAQFDPNAKRILDQMKEKYEQIEAFEAQVTQEVLDAKGEMLGSFAAKATVKKNKYKLDLGDQVIYNNEETVWRHLVDDGEVSIHSNNSEGGGDAMMQSPSKLYKLYKDGFKYALQGTETVNGNTCHLVELAPVDREKFDFFKIKLYIDKASKNLIRWTVFEKDEAGIVSQYRYTISDFNDQLSLKDNFFSFDEKQFPGVDVIDMRE